MLGSGSFGAYLVLGMNCIVLFAFFIITCSTLCVLCGFVRLGAGFVFVVYDAGEDGGDGVGGFNLVPGRTWLLSWPAVCLADAA